LEPSTLFSGWLGVSVVDCVCGVSGKPIRIPEAMLAGGPGRPPRVEVHASRFQADSFALPLELSNAAVILTV
jgi:hypothetical protein